MKHCDTCHNAPGFCSAHREGCPACLHALKVWLAQRVSEELAHARVNGQVYMNGLHNPKPSEIQRGEKVARDFIDYLKALDHEAP